MVLGLARVAVVAGGPEVILLDAEEAGLDEPGLRAWARGQEAALGAVCTSRSYRYPYAMVAWHRASVGIDIERIEPLGRVFLESICTPSEGAAFDQAATDGQVASLWSSKEALAKALGDAVRYDPRRLTSPMLWLEGRAGPWRSARLSAPADHNAWLCWRSIPGSS